MYISLALGVIANLKQIQCLVEYSLMKPIFHCDAKSFALGPGIGLDPQCHNFRLPIPTCWYLKTLKFALLLTQNMKFALPQRKPPMPASGI